MIIAANMAINSMPRYFVVRFFSLVIPLIILLSLVSMIGCTVVAPIDPSDNYQLVWSDEFDGETLDEGKWQYRYLGARKGAINVEDAVWLDGNGHLIISTYKEGDQYHTGMIGTQELFETKFGYWETRMKLQKQQGHWSAFWLQSPDYGQVIGDANISGVEIDIMEYLAVEHDRVHHSLHWDGYSEHQKSASRRRYVAGLHSGFHTFGLEWRPDGYAFYVDGLLTWKTRQAISHRDQYIVLSLEVGDWAGDIIQADLPDSIIVDYVRVYQ